MKFQRIGYGLLLASLALFSHAAYAVTQEEAHAILKAVQVASQRKDIKRVMAYLDPSVILKKEYDPKQLPMDYQAYEAYMTAAVTAIDHYEYKILSSEFKDLKGSVVLKVKMAESYTFNKVQYSETHEQSWFMKDTAAGPRVYQVLIHN